MFPTSPGRPRAARWLVRCAAAAGCLLALSGCVMYPVGYYGHPHPYYYGGGGYGPGWR